MAEQLIDCSARRPGLHRMGLIVDPERMLADMEAGRAGRDRSGPRAPPIHLSCSGHGTSVGMIERHQGTLLDAAGCRIASRLGPGS